MSFHLLLSVPREHYVAVVDLEKAKAFTVDWGVDQAGPTDLNLIA